MVGLGRDDAVVRVKFLITSLVESRLTVLDWLQESSIGCPACIHRLTLILGIGQLNTPESRPIELNELCPTHESRRSITGCAYVRLRSYFKRASYIRFSLFHAHSFFSPPTSVTNSSTVFTFISDCLPLPSTSLPQKDMDLVNHLSDRLLFAVPKKGRLQQPTLDLLAGADIQFRREFRLDIALVKNHPLALIFLPAADIPTFVGEGRVDLGITGGDQVEEHAAIMRKRRIEEERNVDTNGNGDYGEGDSGVETELGDANAEEFRDGVEEILDLGFGRCKLQVQVPENGKIQNPEQLVGKNVVTSFVGLTEQYFRRLEREEDAKRGVSVDGEMIWKGEEAKLRTRIMYVGGSVEAACALGVADGIVDLVGKSLFMAL